VVVRAAVPNFKEVSHAFGKQRKKDLRIEVIILLLRSQVKVNLIMWQRIQTVFLIVVVVGMVAGIFFPIAIYTDPTTAKTYELYPLHYSIKESTQTLTTYFPYSITAILMITSATLAGMCITRYENRMTQVKIGTLNSLILAGTILSAYLFFREFVGQFPAAKLGLVVWIALVAAACNWVALRFIRRDEKLVRDADRLR